MKGFLLPCLATASLAVFPLGAQSIRDLAAERGLRFGAAVDPSHFSESLYSDTLAREFNQVEPENAMKFGPTHPGLNVYSFASADSIAAFAAAHGMALRGHTLVWHSNLPSWLTGATWTTAQLSNILQDHISTVVGHYKDQVFAWDVVNEAFNDNGTLRSTIWSNSPGIGLAGTAYIEQAFRWARAASPKAYLYYNDYNAESTGVKSDAVYAMAKDFKARGVPLDGIGMQMHLTSAAPNLTGIEANMRRLADLGLMIDITELDVRLTVNSSGIASDALLATEAQTYHDIVAVCLKIPLCRGVQTWGFTDKYSWVPGTYPGLGAALEFDAGYRPKPAYASMVGALSNTPPVLAAADLVSAASYGGGSVSPGEIVALFNTNPGPAALAVADFTDGRLPTSLSGVRLLFDGIAAPLLYTVTGQTAAIAPFFLAGRSTTQMQYEYKGIQSAAVTVAVSPVHPALFAANASGSGPGAILDLAYHPVTAANPARRGGYVILYATGAGLTSPLPGDGQLATDTASLSARATVTIGGVDCAVSYAGAAPGLVAGGAQVNVLVSAGVPSGEQPVVLTVGGVSSPASVTVFVE